MKARNSVLLSLLATLLVVCLVPVSVFGDGPWDIDHGGSQETNGGTLIQNRDAVGISAPRPSDGTEFGPETPSFLSSVTYSWLNNLGLTRLAERVLLSELTVRQQSDRPVIRKTRR